jgi:hypothetical protein
VGSTSTASSDVSGSSSTTITGQSDSTTATPGVVGDGRSKDANDGDEDPKSDDDTGILDYGQQAKPATARLITALVEHYYSAAAADNGGVACSLLYSLLEESIPEDYGQPPGPPSLRGKTCAVVMTKLYKQRLGLLVKESARLEVTSVRVDGKKADVLLHFDTTSEPRYIPAHLEFGKWKIDSMFDDNLP